MLIFTIKNLKKFFAFIFTCQIKLVENFDFFKKLQKFNFLYLLFYFLLLFLLKLEILPFSLIFILFTILGIIYFLTNSIDILTSVQKLFSLYFWIVIFFPASILLFIFSDNFIFENAYSFVKFVFFYFIYLLTITSFIDGKVAIIVTSLYTILFSLIFNGLKYYAFLQKDTSLQNFTETLEILSFPIISIFTIASIFAIIKEYWTYKYNGGIDFLNLLNSKNNQQ